MSLPASAKSRRNPGQDLQRSQHDVASASLERDTKQITQESTGGVGWSMTTPSMYLVTNGLTWL